MTKINRKTKETDVKVSLNIYGKGEARIKTEIPFLNHLLEALSKHSLFDLEVYCKGDIDIDFHHSVEDIGMVIGEALQKEIFPIKSIERFGNSTVVMDEASLSCDLDLSNRPFLVYALDIKGYVGNFDVELIEEFLRALCFKAGITAHFVLNRGKNNHHIIEALFKALAVALRRALSINKTLGIPSTKGLL